MSVALRRSAADILSDRCTSAAGFTDSGAVAVHQFIMVNGDLWWLVVVNGG